MSANALRAKVIFLLGDDVSTDAIYPGKHMATVLPSETPQYAFADHAELHQKLRSRRRAQESVIVAGANFGCGSSREQAASCLKGYNLTIVARGFARIFRQNSVNLGLRTVVCRNIEASEGDELEIGEDEILNRTTGKLFAQEPLPAAQRAIVAAGGLIPYTRRLLLAREA